MVILIVVAYVVVGAVEISLWSERPRKQLWVYILLLTAVTILSVLLLLNSELPPPEPNDALRKLWSIIMGGSGQK
jgi:hypothetical protein